MVHLGRVVVVGLVIAACSRGTRDDCAIVRDRPASAMQELSKRYPNDPVKVATTIERCVAPTGDDCDRIGRIIAAIPGMAPQLQAQDTRADPARVCRDAPAELRRCLLPSYALAHSDECLAVMEKLREARIDAIEIEARSKAATQPPRDCGFVAIYVDAAGTWMATGRAATDRCYAPRIDGAIDTDWLEAQLRRAKTHPCGPTANELAGAADVPYQDVIQAMDVSVKTGFVDVGLSTVAELAVPLAASNPKGAPRECPAGLIAPTPAAMAPQAAITPQAPADKSALVKAPVLIVTTQKMSLSIDQVTTDIATLDEARRATKLDGLTRALPPTLDGMLILQADQSTPMNVISLVIETAKASGYDNVLFAVKNK